MSWTFEVVGRPVSLNRERAEHWSRRAAHVETVRQQAKIMAKSKKIPTLKAIRIIGVPMYPERRRRDPGNVYPTLKAVVDGLVDARVIPDDSDDYVVEVVMRRSEVRKGITGGMAVTIEEVA